MITFKNATELLETIAKKHHQIHSFHSGFMDEVDINRLGATDYIILYAEPGTATINKGTMTYTFTLYVLDMVNKAIKETSSNEPFFETNEKIGRINTLSENLQIMNDVINEFHQNLYSTSWVDDEVVLGLPISCEPFTAKFDNVLTGWSAIISMEVNNTNNLCIVPIEGNS
tara:strand:+ start:807 stop:1319 length:513 start_codon:yes stop_codon:yes gene_type:complete